VPPPDRSDDLREGCQKVPVHAPDSSRLARSPRGREGRRSVGDEPTIDRLSELIQNPDWEVQNNAIVGLMDIVLEKPQFVGQNLRVTVFVLMPAVSSLRSGLAESALTCLREIASEFGETLHHFLRHL
jgi:hypothetical protein